MVHTDCLCHQAWAFVNFLDDISRDWCPDLVRPSRFTFKKARMRKMFACIRIISSWFDVILLREESFFFLNFDTWHAFHCPTRQILGRQTHAPLLHELLPKGCEPEVSHSVATAASGYPMDAWIAHAVEVNSEIGISDFFICRTHTPLTWYRMPSKAGCLSRGDVSQHFHLGV